MARYRQSYDGEHRTESLGIKLTPTERSELEQAATAHGTQLSAYVRDLCLKRSPGAVLSARHLPEARELLFELRAIGNNLNQIARRANIHGEVPERAELLEALERLKAAMGKVLDL